eukprot:4304458-Pleurochrysis_carterae.AAC.1
MAREGHDQLKNEANQPNRFPHRANDLSQASGYLDITCKIMGSSTAMTCSTTCRFGDFDANRQALAGWGAAFPSKHWRRGGKRRGQRVELFLKTSERRRKEERQKASESSSF